MTTITEKHLSLIADIYKVIVDERAWPTVLDELARQTGAISTNTIYFDMQHKDLELSFTGSHFTPQMISAYIEEISPLELPLFQQISEVPTGVFYSDRNIFAQAGIDIHSSKVTKWFREEALIKCRSGVRLNDSPGWLDSLTFNFGLERGAMTDSEQQLAKLYLPHFAKAIEISRPFKLLNARFNAVLSALDKFHIGTLILTSSGTVILSNAEAQRILEEKDGILIDHAKRLRIASNRIQDQFAEGLAFVSRTSSAQNDHSGRLLRIPRPAKNSVLLGELVPLAGSGMVLEHSFHGALFLIIDPENRQRISTRGLELVCGLSASESEVCRLLLDGLTTNEIADHRGVQPETVKTQISNLMKKSRATNRVDLVKMAHSLDLPVDGPEEIDASLVGSTREPVKP